MWGSWFGVTVAGVLILAAIVGLAFGTSIAVFGILIALGAAAAIAVGYGFMRASEKSDDVGDRAVAGTQPRNPPAETAPAPHEPAGTP
jgi:hypothetical protein